MTTSDLDADAHDWFAPSPFDYVESCRKCGVVKSWANDAGPCKGVAPLTAREPGVTGKGEGEQ